MEKWRARKAGSSRIKTLALLWVLQFSVCLLEIRFCYYQVSKHSYYICRLYSSFCKYSSLIDKDRIRRFWLDVYQLIWDQLDSIQGHSDNTQTPKIWHILDYQDKQAGSKVQSEKTIKDFKSVSEETKDKVTLFLTSLAANLGLWQLELGWCRRENIWSWGIFHSATKTQSNRDTI